VKNRGKEAQKSTRTEIHKKLNKEKYRHGIKKQRK
jgi:hypothetical protein